MSSPKFAQTTTRTLIEKYLSGDRESERQLFEAHRSELVARVGSSQWMSGLSAHVTPEDLVDEVFLRALSSGFLRHFEDRGRGSLTRALAAILDDVAVDTYRRLGASKRGGRVVARSYDRQDEVQDTRQGTVALPSREVTPTSNARARELLKLCQELLEPREWEVWRLCELEGLDSPAVAERLNTSDAAVRGVLHRARKRILRALAGELPDSER